MRYKFALHWFRRDLRLKDNRSLSSACECSQFVFLCFIFDSHILDKLKSRKDSRVEFIFNSLKSINEQLLGLKTKILILHGAPEKLLPDLCKKLDVSAVFTNEDYESYAKKRDSKVKKLLNKQGTDFRTFKDHVIFSGSEVSKEDASAYRAFTPYKKAWLAKLSAQKDLKEYPLNKKHLAPVMDKSWRNKNLKNKNLNFIINKSWTLEDLNFQKIALTFPAGENSAQKRLKAFSKKIDQYHKQRDFPCLYGTSQLSVYLRHGNLSIREAVRRALQKKNSGQESWLSELIWREFYSMILNCFPYVEKTAFIKKYQNIQWDNKKSYFRAWCEGRTGFPIVDAGMRELNQTGFMPNRMRMITASFLVKDLLLDWRKGERYFADKLLDFDLASNNGGWQWCAGTGCSAQPYFRIFNPVSQSQKFDPKGLYIKKWVKELKSLNFKQIHFPLKYQANLPIHLGKDYPFPLVDHKIQREKALKRFKAIVRNTTQK